MAQRLLEKITVCETEIGGILQHINGLKNTSLQYAQTIMDCYVWLDIEQYQHLAPNLVNDFIPAS